MFADVNEQTGNLDPASFEQCVTVRTAAVIPVHFAGHPADMDAITAIATRHGLAVVEDAAQAHGASWQGRMVGSFGAFGSFSFQSSKNLTAGEGGALTTNDDMLADMAWSLHHCGRTHSGAWYEHARAGGNHRMTEIQAALLLAQLDHLDEQVARREHAAARLDAGLAGIDGLTVRERDPRCTHHAHHLYHLGYDRGALEGVTLARFVEAVRAEGVPIGPGYALPLYRQPVFAEARFDTGATGFDAAYPPTAYHRLRLPVSERLCAESLWLPQQLLLADDEDIDDVIESVAKVRGAIHELEP